MSTTVAQLLSIAVNELGVKESPPNSNNVKYNTDYYGGPVSGSAYPWCCAFIYWVFKQAGASELFAGGTKTAWCPYAMHWYEQVGAFYTRTWDFLPGDIIFFNFQGGKMAGHIGIVESVNSDGSVVCIEGNTSVSSQDNGGSVMRRTRYPSVILGAGRPKYQTEQIKGDEDEMVRFNKLSDIPDNWDKHGNPRAMINMIMDANILSGDGSDPDGNDDVIDLSIDMVRIIALEFRAGMYDTAIRAAGYEPNDIR